MSDENKEYISKKHIRYNGISMYDPLIIPTKHLLFRIPKCDKVADTIAHHGKRMALLQSNQYKSFLSVCDFNRYLQSKNETENLVEDYPNENDESEIFVYAIESHSNAIKNLKAIN